MAINITTLNGCSIEQITAVFNLSFSDYLLPFHLTPEQLAAKMSADKVNLDYSVGVFDNNTLVAFILHGFDILDGKRVIYNGGTGVIPESRGAGLTRKMYEFIDQKLEDERIDYLLLEVISQNIQAIKSYQRAGFHITRELSCYKGVFSEIDFKNSLNTSPIVIRNLEEYRWSSLQTFWDFSPTWQNSINVIDSLKESNISLGAYLNDTLVGYLIYNPSSKRVQQLAVDNLHRRMGIGSSLLNHIAEHYNSDISIINVDSGSLPITSFLLSCGFSNFLTQLEMRRDLK